MVNITCNLFLSSHLGRKMNMPIILSASSNLRAICEFSLCTIGFPLLLGHQKSSSGCWSPSLGDLFSSPYLIKKMENCFVGNFLPFYINRNLVLCFRHVVIVFMF